MNIIVYTQQNCPPCKRFKKWLDENNVIYENRNISTSHYKKEFIDRGLRMTPTTIIELENGSELILKGIRNSSKEKILEISKT